MDVSSSSSPCTPTALRMNGVDAPAQGRAREERGSFSVAWLSCVEESPAQTYTTTLGLAFCV